MIFYIDITDNRLVWTKEILDKAGYETEEYSSNLDIKENSTIIFSPAKKFSLQDVYFLPNNTTVVCGYIPEIIKKEFNTKNITHLNLMQNEKFAICNSILTAEAVLALAISNHPDSIFKSKIAITGSGRLAKSIAVLFGKLNLQFSLVIFRESKTFDENYILTKKVLSSAEFFNEINCYDIIINTIPANIFNNEIISKIHQNCLFIETASTPSFDVAQNRNFELLPAPALPSRFCPKSAGHLIYEYIIKNLRTGENND